jgi:hypothetical protein
MTHRPHRLLTFLLVVALIALFAAKCIEIAITLREAATYAALAVPLSPTVRLAFAGFWALALAILAFDLIRRRGWARWWAAPLFTLYAASHWAWQALFFRADYDRGRLPFQAALSVVLLLPVWWMVWRRGWLRRSAPHLPPDSPAQ